MKKILLSFFVIAVFIVYTIHLKSGGDKNKILKTIPQNSSTDTNNQTSTSGAVSQNTRYKDGVYIGDTADAFYGNIQVQVVITKGKISDVQFLQYPNDRQTSIDINTQAMPILKQEAIAIQTAHVDGVSGATATSEAFIKSLQSALGKAV